MKGIFNRIFTDTWLKAEADAGGFRQSAQGKKFDRKVLFVAVAACICLVFIEYIAKDPGYIYLRDLFSAFGFDTLSLRFSYLLEKHPDRQLFALGYWVAVIALCYVLIPVGLIKFVFREKISDYGIRRGTLFRDYKLYLAMLVIMIPLVYLFSRTDGFQYRYPFYRMEAGADLWPRFWIWQGLYLLQFFCLEFFFRGFLVHGLKERFGYYSVFIMTIPYCMIHFGKPMPETIAAIVAGIILGTLSLKSRSVWLGVVIHYTVAIMMDLSALWQKGHWN